MTQNIDSPSHLKSRNVVNHFLRSYIILNNILTKAKSVLFWVHAYPSVQVQCIKSKRGLPKTDCYVSDYVKITYS